MAMTQAYLLNRITNFLGSSVKQGDMLSNYGYGRISIIISCKYDKIREWCTAKSKLKITRGVASYGDQKIKCIQSLAWWATELIIRGNQIELSDFDATMTSILYRSSKIGIKSRE